MSWLSSLFSDGGSQQAAAAAKKAADAAKLKAAFAAQEAQRLKQEQQQKAFETQQKAMAQDAAARQQMGAANQTAVSGLGLLNQQQQVADSQAATPSGPSTGAPAFNIGQARTAQLASVGGVGAGVAQSVNPVNGTAITPNTGPATQTPMQQQGFKMPSMTGITFGGS